MFQKVGRCIGMAFMLLGMHASDLLASDTAEEVSAAGPEGGETALGLPYYYAQTSWPSLHRDARNSDFTPFAVSRSSQVRWTALDGAAMVLAPSIDSEGNVYATTGQGAGTSHLHVYDRDGHLLWESEPQADLDGLDFGAVGNGPLIDRWGDIYLSDVNQLWAFHPGGAVKWVVPLPANSGALISPVLNREGHVGGVTANGQVIFFRRDDGQLVYPILDLPGSGGPIPSEPPPDGIWAGGLLDPEIIEALFYGLFGNVYEVVNTPVIHPETGRLYITAGGATPEEGVLYGIDAANGALEIAFQMPLAGGSGSSPALSVDGSKVFAVGGDAVMKAFDAQTGAVVWSANGAESAASPSVGRDGTVYMGFLESLTALHPDDGTVKWTVNLNEKAADVLPFVPSSRLLGPNRTPLILINSVITVTPRYLWVSVVFSYEFSLSEQELALGLPRAYVLLALRPEDGSVAGGTLLRDSCGGTISVGSRGEMYVSHAALISSFYYYEINPYLPNLLKTPAPIGGFTALRPIRQRDLFTSTVGWMRELGQEALAELPDGDAEAAGKKLLMAVSQLEATRDSLPEAVELGELAPLSAEGIRQRLDEARSYLLAAEGNLSSGMPVSAAQQQTDAYIAKADQALVYALALWPVIPSIAPDYDSDGDVDSDDAELFRDCMTGPALQTIATGCTNRDLDGDLDVDLRDFAPFQRCLGDGVGGTDLGCLP